MIISTILVLLLTSLILFSLRIVYGRRKYAHIKSPPFMRVLEFFPGHANGFGRYQKQYPKKVFTDYIGDCFHAIGDTTMVIHIYHKSDVWTIDVNKVATVLSHSDTFWKSSFDCTFLAKFCGERFLGKHNLVFSPGGNIWQTKRKIMDTAFHRSSLRQTFEGMKTASNNLIETLHDVRKDGEIIDIYGYFTGAALEVITRTGFSIDEDVKSAGMAQGVEDLLDGLARALRVDLTFILPWLEITLKAKIGQTIRTLREYLTTHLMKRINNTEDMKNKNDILAHIIKANLSVEGCNVEEIIDDFLSFLLAGMETTSNSMSFFIMVMLRHPDIFTKVRKEVDTVYNGRTELEYEDLNKLVYLEQCIKETMRLYSVGEITTRQSLVGTSVDGLYLPKGTIIKISQSLIQRDPRYWGPDAETFNPENFAPDKTIKPFTYMPFMVGPRSCIGKHFAMMELKILLSKVLLNFELYNPNQSGSERIPCKADVTKKPLEGVPVIMKPR